VRGDGDTVAHAELGVVHVIDRGVEPYVALSGNSFGEDRDALDLLRLNVVRFQDLQHRVHQRMEHAAMG
jgi:hypothetical protein